MATNPPSYSPGRPPSAKDLELMLNGTPSFLGILTSSGSTVVVNNSTTATPFNTGQVGSRWPLRDTLAGRVLCVQPTSAGLFMAASSAGIGPNFRTVALQSVIPPLLDTEPGVLLQAGERVYITMLPTHGWLQWLSNTGSASLIMWEMV